MRALFITVMVVLSLAACSGNNEHSKEENMKRNDTSNHSTDIGNNKSY